MPGDTPALDRDDALRRLGGDEDLFCELLAVFLEDLPASLSELQAARQAKDGERLAATAHRIKGAALNLGAKALAAAAEALETSGSTGAHARVEEEARRLRALVEGAPA
ncbi:MAG: hypothetical protein Kow0092_25800 [Deferrisomatales bacterium]